ncbi:MAG: outer membrane protein assembly factor BamD [Gemmatimonadaceae bacterium]|nr:outer membrane protein assembly factor BamD [Gemmatimonadaceae bacterium]NUO95686.1 outer membrane protein assembly factor BamD [Gemmatimonadaceae bacterium]NUP55921.1 outer membrane protein assembly factor BamD [Gemmatimonadaceae bacterium]NUP71904.1 outer membrane protein assembly factor BamD [Gemmatimonadaceae bacterium]NUS33878.1 outer membrane protein assembly factor BamD [Gemmatimonadaceae bacterium]
MISSRRALVATLLLLAAACHPDFEITKFPTNEALYRAATEEFARGRWDNAVAAFEKLTTDLPARDTLLPRAHWYLARAHQEKAEWVLAATSFSRLTESFPDDSLADDAALEAARSYRKLWRKPALDPTYGESALASYNTLLGLYPTSPLIPQARKELADLEEMFAQKNYLSGMYYFRRGGYDSGIIYFKDVINRYPQSASARLAQLRLVDSYKKIRYREDAVEACAALRKRFPDDAEVRATCADVAAPPSPVASNPASAPPPSTGPPATPIHPPTP